MIETLFETVPSIGTGISLFAFLVAVIAFVIRAKFKNTLRELQSIPEDKRAEKLSDPQNPYVIKLTDIPREERYDFAERTLKHRERIFFNASIFVGFIFVLATIITIFQMQSNNNQTNGPGCIELLRRADSSLVSGNYQAARDFFLGAREQCPESWKPFHGLGRTEFANGKYSSAEKYLKQAFELNSNDGTIKYGIAMTQEAGGKYKDALVSLNEARKLLRVDSAIAKETEYDIGLVNLLLWKKTGDSANIKSALLQFRARLEDNHNPSHWVHYHIACILATMAKTAADSVRENQINEALEHAQQAEKELNEYRSDKAPKQREMFKVLIDGSRLKDWERRGPGYPVACEPLATIWESHRTKMGVQ